MGQLQCYITVRNVEAELVNWSIFIVVELNVNQNNQNVALLSQVTVKFLEVCKRK